MSPVTIGCLEAWELIKCRKINDQTNDRDGFVPRMGLVSPDEDVGS